MVKKRRNKNPDSIKLNAETDLMKTLWDISQSLYQFLNIDDLILHVIKRIREVMTAEGVSVILHDEEKNEFVFCWAEDEASEIAVKLKEIRFPVDHGIAGSVFRSGKAEILSNVKKDPRHYKEVDNITQFITKSMIAAPLQKREKTLGVLEVLNKKKGIFDEKDLTFLTTLTPIIAMALDNAMMYAELHKAHEGIQEENIRLRQEIERRYRFNKIIGNSDQMLDVFRLCEKVMDSDISVLIEGETGTGKELIARSIHYNSRRKSKPFVTQNCGGVPETLLASELFGHKRGAFTGATSDKKGLFEIANGGTIFLDEVAEMSPAMQTSLLRVVQEGEIKPLGAEYSSKVDIRVISATNRNLQECVNTGEFREDLFYRLNVFSVTLPALRERVGDIPMLATHFIQKYSQRSNKSIKGIRQNAIRCLEAYPFPGNVRELENEIERAMAMAQDGEFIELSNLSDKIRSKTGEACIGLTAQGTLKEMVETLEKSVLSQMLEEHRGNKSKIAAELGLSRYGLRKKMQRYGF
ncbi:MAG: sigma 54-interacting transcriptional regulator [Deltaproteobacteria bacterium]|nr:MAG: sigma 54-interacting transcriptional regulator [Deltaproteobacteria bacterium]